MGSINNNQPANNTEAHDDGSETTVVETTTVVTEEQGWIARHPVLTAGIIVGVGAAAYLTYRHYAGDSHDDTVIDGAAAGFAALIA
jgi:hypothetical protein